MAVTLRFTVEDIATQLLTYTHINVYRATSLGGTYTSIGMVTLVAGTYHYSYSDANGTLNHWYKFCYWHAPATESAKSDPFRVDGVTRLRIRQGAMGKYGAGLVFAAAAGGDTDTIATDDYRIKASQFPTNRGKGSWLLVATGTYAGQKRLIKSTVPASGTMDIEVVLAGALTAGDDVEWHWMANPDVWNDAINRGLDRYHYLDRVPVNGVANQEEYDLSSLPWLADKDQIHDVRWYPTSGTDVDESFASNGKWFRPRQDGEKIYLVIYPSIAATDILYLEATRPMPKLYTDDAALPLVANEALCVALAYDEVLSYLTRPGNGTSEERASWKSERKRHAKELHQLLVDNRPKPRYAPARPSQPTVVSSRFVAR
jgi:hypothetical protein